MKLILKDVFGGSLVSVARLKLLYCKGSPFLQWMTNYLNVVRKALI